MRMKMLNNTLDLELDNAYEVLENGQLEVMKLSGLDISSMGNQTILRMWFTNNRAQQVLITATETDDFVITFSKLAKSVYSGSPVKSYDALCLRTKSTFPHITLLNETTNSQKTVVYCEKGHTFVDTGLIWTFCKICNINGELDKKKNEYRVKK